MFRNYLLITLRNLKKHKWYSFINITGLAVGMACCILMFLWVQNELSYDRFHENADDIYRVIIEKRTEHGSSYDVFGPSALGPALKEKYPEFVDYAITSRVFTGWHLYYGDKGYVNDVIIAVTPQFLRLFSFPFVKGDPETALNERNSVVLTENMAKKYFGDADPMGKVILDEDGGDGYKVTGLIENIPDNSHLQVDCIMSIIGWNLSDDDWRRLVVTTYVQLKKNSSVKDVSQKISGIVKAHYSESRVENISLQPLTKIHLYSDFDKKTGIQRRMAYMYFLSLVALFIFLIACINYMNLSTARSSIRAKEIGIRKVAGAYKKDIITQFFSESIILSFFALPLAVFLTELVLPLFNILAGKQLTMDFSSKVLLIFVLLIITLITGLVSGSYPALFLSSFQPVSVLKGMSKQGARSGSVLRRILIIAQFSFAIILIIGTITIFSQLSYMKNYDLGFNKDYLISFEMHGDFNKNKETIKYELLQHPNIINVTRSNFAINSNLPRFSRDNPINKINWEGKKPQEEIMLYPAVVDYDFLETFNIQIVKGRFFSKEYTTDVSNIVLNETAAKAMGLTDPIGKRISVELSGYLGNEKLDGFIIGVVKDYHQCSLHSEVQPFLLTLAENITVDMTVKMRPENIQETIRFIDSKWKEYLPGFDLPYVFLDDTIEKFYKEDVRIGTIFKYFTFLAIFIACLGLFGLVSFLVEQKTKEIGIRKVLGSSVRNIVLLLTKEYTKWVVIANVIAWPVGYLAMKIWLQNFAYRINMSWNIFIISGVAAFSIAMITVSYQSIKAARANPADSLKYE